MIIMPHNRMGVTELRDTHRGEHLNTFATPSHLIWPLLSNMQRLKNSMKSGLGCPYHDLGADHAHGEMRFSAPWMQHNLIQNILPGLEGVVERLQAGADVADV